MGFTPKPTILKLVFDEDTPLHGLTVRARPCTVGEWNEMLEQSTEKHTNGKEVKEANERIAQMFLDYAVDWDMEIPEGSPLPLTMEGWKKIGNDHADLIITAWQFAMVSIPKPSNDKSPDGETSAEQELGLDNLSESLPSWNPPSS